VKIRTAWMEWDDQASQTVSLMNREFIGMLFMISDYVYSLISILVANRHFRQDAAFASVFSRDASAVA